MQIYLINVLQSIKKFKSLLKVMNGDGMGVINSLTVVRIKSILQNLLQSCTTGMLFEYYNLY